MQKTGNTTDATVHLASSSVGLRQTAPGRPRMRIQFREASGWSLRRHRKMAETLRKDKLEGTIII